MSQKTYIESTNGTLHMHDILILINQKVFYDRVNYVLFILIDVLKKGNEVLGRILSIVVDDVVIRPEIIFGNDQEYYIRIKSTSFQGLWDDHIAEHGVIAFHPCTDTFIFNNVHTKPGEQGYVSVKEEALPLSVPRLVPC